jgi:hypothetical protein
LLSEEEKNQQQSQFKEEEAKLELQAKILGTKKKLATARIYLDNAKYAKTFNVETVISYMNEVNSLELGLEALEALEKELF